LPNLDPRLLQLWLEEDIGSGDITTEALIGDDIAQAKIIAKTAGTLCGLDSISDIAEALGFSPSSLSFREDGASCEQGDIVCTFQGPHSGLLKAERTYLNLIQHLCGVSTSTARYNKAVAHTRANILDTRKTIPGLRLLDKRAVKAGGGHNHRMGLYDAFLIKENHVEAFRHLPNPFLTAIETARRLHQDRPVIIEVQSETEAHQALEGLPEVILLDNMDCETMARIVDANEKHGLGTELEASGGITLERLVAVAETGVHRISVGAITHSALPMDLSMLISKR
jgi:nicotinate-nucleotide pyrophosphorylase (carboxylating)